MSSKTYKKRFYPSTSHKWPPLELTFRDNGLLQSILWRDEKDALDLAQTPEVEKVSCPELYDWLMGYFTAKPTSMLKEPPSEMDFEGMAPFTRRVRELCFQIPFGETMTYQQLAELAGSPKASRAVGQAMANNPYHLLIPCHRVIGSKGDLTGYRGGLSIKSALLAWEASAIAGQRTHGQNVTKDCA